MRTQKYKLEQPEKIDPKIFLLTKFSDPKNIGHASLPMLNGSVPPPLGAILTAVCNLLNLIQEMSRKFILVMMISWYSC